MHVNHSYISSNFADLMEKELTLREQFRNYELDYSKNLEVKTKSPSGVDVKIASEFQLEVSPGKGLELFVVSIQSDFSVGIHIRDLIMEIKKLVQESSGDSTILWKALSQKNITAKNVNHMTDTDSNLSVGFLTTVQTKIFRN